MSKTKKGGATVSTKKEKEGIESFRKKMKKEKLLPELIPYIRNSDFNIPWVKHELANLPINNPFEESELNGLINYTFKSNKKIYEEYLNEKNYEMILWTIPKPFRTNWFIKNYREIYNVLGENKYYSLLGDVFVDVRFHYNTKSSYNKLIYIGTDPSKMMDKIEKRHFEKLPENLTIYRGISYKQRITENNYSRFLGYSWTLDKKKAIWFSRNNSVFTGKKYSTVLSTEVSKKQVLAFFTSRKEKEIFIDYTRLSPSQINLEEIDINQ